MQLRYYDQQSTQAEIERLERVYQGYEESSANHTLWSTTNSGNQAMIAERTAILGRLLQSAGLVPLNERLILDIGCGNGAILAYFMAWGAAPQHLYGVDLLPQNIETAKRLYPALYFQQSNAEQVTFDDNRFDLVLCFTLFSSILDPYMSHNIAREADRILKPGGAVVWYDVRFRNPLNPHTQPLTKKKIRTLFPDFTPHLHSTTLLPPLARRLGRFTSVLYPLLTRISFLHTHYLGLLIKPKGVQ